MTDPSATWAVVSDEAQLRELVGAPIPRVADKVRTTLHELDRAWLAAPPKYYGPSYADRLYESA